METQNKDGIANEQKQTDLSDPATWVDNALRNTNFPLSGGDTDGKFLSANDEQTPEEEKREHKHFLDEIDTDFPLSGGAHDSDPFLSGEEKTPEEEEREHKHFLDDINTNFPLSGGTEL
jgi:hypothetical protein